LVTLVTLESFLKGVTEFMIGDKNVHWGHCLMVGFVVVHLIIMMLIVGFFFSIIFIIIIILRI